MPNLLACALTTGALNPIYAYCAISFFIVTIYQFFRRSAIAINGVKAVSFWMLLIWGLSYMFIGTRQANSILWHIATPAITFLAGWVICELSRTDKETAFRRLILFMLLGFMIHASLNYKVNIGLERWNMVDYFSGIIRAATGSGCINTFAVSLIGYWIFIEKRKKWKFYGFLITIPFILYVLQLGTRTQAIILVMVFLAVLILFTYENSRQKSSFKILLGILLSGTVCVFLYKSNLLGIRDLILSSNLASHFHNNTSEQIAADTYRYQSIFNGLKCLIEHPFGGQIERNAFHNLWLDIGRIGGIIPFVAMVLFTAVNTVHMFRIFKNKKFDIRTRYMALSITLGILLNFLTEPVIEGLMDFFLAYCLVSGMIEAMYYYEKVGIFNHDVFVPEPKIRLRWM